MTLLRPSLALAIASILAAGAVLADKDRDSDDRDRRESGRAPDWADEDRSYDRARRAAERGEILPLEVIFERALARVPGRVLEAELKRKRGIWVYELKILDARGRLFEVYLDASTGDLLKHEEED